MGLLVFVVGAVFGSFLNMCIHRLPRSLSIVRPGSFCPHCRHKLAWFDNIPLVSYLVLRGHCRYCRNLILPRYFIVELLTSSLFLVLYLRFDISASFYIFSLLMLALILASFIDWEHYLIPDLVVYPGIILGLIFNFAFPELAFSNDSLYALKESFFGALVGGGLLYLTALAGEVVMKKEAMGGGDVKLLAMIGAFLGWRPVLLTIFFGSIIGSVVSLALIGLKIKKRTDYIPFGPYLSLGAVISLFYKGSTFLGYYI